MKNSLFTLSHTDGFFFFLSVAFSISVPGFCFPLGLSLEGISVGFFSSFFLSSSSPSRFFLYLDGLNTLKNSLLTLSHTDGFFFFFLNSGAFSVPVSGEVFSSLVGEVGLTDTGVVLFTLSTFL